MRYNPHVDTNVVTTFTNHNFNTHVEENLVGVTTLSGGFSSILTDLEM